MNKDALEKLREARGGDHESEIIKLKLIPIDDLWKEAPDAKALSALYLFVLSSLVRVSTDSTQRM